MLFAEVLEYFCPQESFLMRETVSGAKRVVARILALFDLRRSKAPFFQIEPIQFHLFQ
jgi:hypothetical protein